MSKGETEGWGSRYILTCAAIAGVSLTGFLLVESLVEHGIMDLHLLKRPVFAACFLLTAVRSVALYGGTFLLPVFLQNFKGLDEVESGLLMLPGSLFMGLLMPFTGRLSDKVSPRLLAFIGFCLLAVSFFNYRTIDVDTSDWGIIMPTMFRGLGIALLIAPVTATAMNAVPKHMAGMAASMLNVIQQVGGSIGIAILGLTLVRRTKYHLNLVGSAVSMDSPAYKTAFKNVFHRAHEIGHSNMESMRIAAVSVGTHVAKAASVRAFQDSFIVGGVVVLLALFCVFFLPSKPATRSSAEPIHLE
jgi:DHA2 family multidrug resistance protein